MKAFSRACDRRWECVACPGYVPTPGGSTLPCDCGCGHPYLIPLNSGVPVAAHAGPTLGAESSGEAARRPATTEVAQ